jgi:hypothetical protein
VKPLGLQAMDCEDLGVIAAAMESAVVRIADISYMAKARSFEMMTNRFVWEDALRDDPGAKYKRIRCGLVVRDVKHITRRGFDPSDSKGVMELLTIECEAREDAAATLTMIFAGDAAIRLDVECVDVTLKDIGEPWPARRKPEHDRDATNDIERTTGEDTAEENTGGDTAEDGADGR